MIIDEKTMFDLLNNSKVVALVEPPYKRKYIPLGLAKISSYLKKKNKKVIFSRGITNYKDIPDLFCVTSLFTYFYEEIIETINIIKFLYPSSKILLGGISATLIPRHFPEDIYIFTGVSKVLDRTVPDYSIDYNVEEPWDNFSYTFTTRGCPNKCHYCAVSKIEPEMEIVENWKEHIVDDKKFINIFDNNLSAFPVSHLENIVTFLEKSKKKVLFDNGFDCKHISNEVASLLARVNYYGTGLRIAFDRIEEDGVFQEAVKTLIKNGVPKKAIMSFVIFNFNDTPKEADYRMRECVKLGIRPYPKQFVPLNNLNKKDIYISKYWTLNLLRAFRFFWLMAGYYTKYDFETWAKNQNDFVLNKEDWDTWNMEKNNAKVNR